MLSPPKLVDDLEKLAARYVILQKYFADFAQDVAEFFTKNGTVKGLIFRPQAAAKEQITKFGVVLAGRELLFSFEMVKFQGLVTVSDTTDKDHIETKVTSTFNGQGETSLKTEQGDVLSIIGGEGRHLFVHLVHEATKSLTN